MATQLSDVTAMRAKLGMNTHHHIPNVPTTASRIRILAGVLVLLATLTYGIHSLRSWAFADIEASSVMPVPETTAVSVSDTATIDWALLEQRLGTAIQRAEARAQTALQRNGQALRRNIRHRFQQGARPFAESVTGWRSSFQLVRSKLPFTDSNGHKRFIEARWNQHLFRPQTYQRWLTQATQGLVQDLRAIEDELAIEIGHILDEILPKDAEETDASQHFMAAMSHTLDQARRASVSAATSQVGTLIMGEVVTLVAIRLGVSSGVLTTGAVSGKVTFGIGLIAGIIVERVWNWIDNPADRVAQSVLHTGTQLAVMTHEAFRAQGSKQIRTVIDRWSTVTALAQERSEQP